ncbi:MAG TPA: maleylpyruvate isomerase family mycothiol-dependent enzyme [Acidimicrobiales bacterium]|nr:maleylpyruvate isomerase family mycothiol-dependent enzyme [Acidimicrobiales bacterium]
MPLGRTEVIDGVAAELDHFADLIAGLNPEAWSTPSRCAGWTVADIAGHVTGLTADIAAGRLDRLADDTHPEDQAAERRGRASAEVAAELEAATPAVVAGLRALDDDAWAAPAPAGLGGTVGSAVLALWCEAYIHGDDIRDALGRSPERGPGLRAAVEHLAGVLEAQGWGPATLALEAMDPIPVGGGGSRLAGDPLLFVLVATGRAHHVELGLTQPLNIYDRPARP